MILRWELDKDAIWVLYCSFPYPSFVLYCYSLTCRATPLTANVCPAHQISKGPITTRARKAPSAHTNRGHLHNHTWPSPPANRLLYIKSVHKGNALTLYNSVTPIHELNAVPCFKHISLLQFHTPTFPWFENLCRDHRWSAPHSIHRADYHTGSTCHQLNMTMNY